MDGHLGMRGMGCSALKIMIRTVPIEQVFREPFAVMTSISFIHFSINSCDVIEII